MDKFAFLQELCTISSDPTVNSQNFELGMNFSNSIDLFYEALLSISNKYNAFGDISVSPIDFSKFTIPPGEFYFTFSKNVKQVIDCNSPIQCQSGVCFVRENDNAAGYIIETRLNGVM